MNCTSTNQKTNGTNKVPPLKARCNRIGIHVPGDNPTPAEVIPIIESRLAAHMNHVGRSATEYSGDFVEWKLIHDEYQEFLQQLRDLASSAHKPENNFSAQNAAPSEPSVANQRSTGEPEVSSSEPDPSQSEPKLTSNEPGSPKTSQNTTRSISAEEEIDNEQQESENDEEEDDDHEDENFDINDYLDDKAADAALDLKEHLSGRSPLDRLSPTAQQALLRLMEDHKLKSIVRAIAEPPPIGLGVRTSVASLKRFRERYRDAKEECQKAQHAKAIQDILAKAGESDEAFQAAVQCVLKARLLNAASEPNASLETIDALITSLAKLRKQALAERKQLHAERIKPSPPQKQSTT